MGLWSSDNTASAIRKNFEKAVSRGDAPTAKKILQEQGSALSNDTLLRALENAINDDLPAITGLLLEAGVPWREVGSSALSGVIYYDKREIYAQLVALGANFDVYKPGADSSYYKLYLARKELLETAVERDQLKKELEQTKTELLAARTKLTATEAVIESFIIKNAKNNNGLNL